MSCRHSGACDDWIVEGEMSKQDKKVRRLQGMIIFLKGSGSGKLSAKN